MKNRNFRIAILLKESDYFYQGVIKGIERNVSDSPFFGEVRFREAFTVKENPSLKEWFPDGIIADYNDRFALDGLKDIDVPVVWINDLQSSHKRCSATKKDFDIINAIGNLRSQGVRQFAFYGAPDANNSMSIVGSLGMQFMDALDHGDYEASTFIGNDCKLIKEWLKSLSLGTGILTVTNANVERLINLAKEINSDCAEKLTIANAISGEIVKGSTNFDEMDSQKFSVDVGVSSTNVIKTLLHKPAQNLSVLISVDQDTEHCSTEFMQIRDPYVAKAMQYIRENIHLNLKVVHIINELEISRHELEKRFFIEFGKTLHKTMTAEKLEIACNLLMDESNLVEDISYMCGYSSPQLMYKTFKKFKKMTPSEYRANNIPAKSK